MNTNPRPTEPLSPAEQKVFDEMAAFFRFNFSGIARPKPVQSTHVAAIRSVYRVA